MDQFFRLASSVSTSYRGASTFEVPTTAVLGPYRLILDDDATGILRIDDYKVSWNDNPSSDKNESCQERQFLLNNALRLMALALAGSNFPNKHDRHIHQSHTECSWPGKYSDTNVENSKQQPSRVKCLSISKLAFDNFKETCFGMPLQELRALLPSWKYMTETAVCRSFTVNDTCYSQAYLRLLHASVANGFPMSDHFGLAGTLLHCQKRLPSRLIADFMTTLDQVSRRSFAEGLLRCAISTGQAAMVGLLLSQTKLWLGVSRADPDWRLECQSMIFTAAMHRDYETTRILLQHQGDLDENLDTNGRNLGSLYALLHGDHDYLPTNILEDSRNDEVIFKIGCLLLDAGARVCIPRILMILAARKITRPFSDLVVEIFRHGGLEWQQWIHHIDTRRLICRLEPEVVTTIIQELIRVGVTFRYDGASTYHRYHDSSRSPAPPEAYIDIAAWTGNLEVLKLLRESDVRFTSATMDDGIRGANQTMIQYLLQNMGCFERASSFSLNVAKDLCQQGPGTIQLLRAYDRASRLYRAEICAVAVFAAAEEGDATQVEAALHSLESLHDSRALDEVASYALILAVRLENLDAAFLLINRGGTGFRHDDDGTSALYYALLSQNKELVISLLEVSYSLVGQQNSCKHQNPIELALQLDEPWVTRRLLEAVSGDYFPDSLDGDSLLSLLDAKGTWKDTDTIVALIQHAEACSSNRAIPILSSILTIAYRNGRSDVMDRLFACEKIWSDRLPLLKAFDGNIDELSYFARERDDRHPLGPSIRALAMEHLVWECKLKELKILLQDLQKQPDYQKLLSCLHYTLTYTTSYRRDIRRPISLLGAAMRHRPTDILEATRILLEHGIDSNTVIPPLQGIRDSCSSFSRSTALLHAIGKKNVALVQLLLAHNAHVNPTLTDDTIHTPLQEAAIQGSFEITQILLSNGADPNSAPARPGGATALQYAARGGFVGIVELLINSGADPDAPGSRYSGGSALESAARHGRLAVVQFLLGHGVRPKLRQPSGEYREVRGAREGGHFAIADLLQSEISNPSGGWFCGSRVEEILALRPVSSSTGSVSLEYRTPCEGAANVYDTTDMEELPSSPRTSSAMEPSSFEPYSASAYTRNSNAETQMEGGFNSIPASSPMNFMSLDASPSIERITDPYGELRDVETSNPLPTTCSPAVVSLELLAASDSIAEVHEESEASAPVRNPVLTTKQRYTCTHCSRSYGRLSSLIRHSRLEHQHKQRLYHCCGISFDRKDTFDRHKRIHTGEGRYWCGGCKTTVRKDYWGKHLKTCKQNGEAHPKSRGKSMKISARQSGNRHG